MQLRYNTSNANFSCRDKCWTMIYTILCCTIRAAKWFCSVLLMPKMQWKERNCTCCCLRELRWQLAVYSRAERWLAGHPTTAASLIITGRQNIRSFYFISCICVTSASMALILLCTSFKNRQFPVTVPGWLLPALTKTWQLHKCHLCHFVTTKLVESAFFL